jgi:hypothetical protein
MTVEDFGKKISCVARGRTFLDARRRRIERCSIIEVPETKHSWVLTLAVGLSAHGGQSCSSCLNAR